MKGGGGFLELKRIFFLNIVILNYFRHFDVVNGFRDQISNFDVMFHSIEYKSALKREEDILNAALDEIDNYCTLNNWLVDIYKFCVKWTSDSPKEYRGAPAFTIEVSEVSHRFPCSGLT